MSDWLLKASYRHAARHRRGLDHVVFVGVTGSAGKTTTKDLVAAVLASRYGGSKSPGTHNSGHWVSDTVLGVRRGDGFCVMELGATGPGSLDEPIALVRPGIAVITNIGGDHRKAFRTLDATADREGQAGGRGAGRGPGGAQRRRSSGDGHGRKLSRPRPHLRPYP